MQSRIGSYFSRTKKLFSNPFLRKKPHRYSTGFCCISISPTEIILVSARNADQFTIEFCESYPYKNESDLLPTLTSIVNKKNIKNQPTTLMLQPENYQLLITDSLPVTPAEFQSAIRWKIKDLIRYPANDIVVDSFTIPKMRANVKKIMVVVAQMSKLEKLSELIRQAGLDLNFIDIPELALRNIAVLYEKDKRTSAFIYVQESNIQLLFIAEHQIYISRLLKININTENNETIEQGMQRLGAEIQRSFDYYQSLWDKPNPSYFLFSSTKLIGPEATEILTDRVKVPVEFVNIDDVITCKQKINFAQQGRCLPVIGGVLRENTKDVATS